MKPKLPGERGQALILIAFAAIALFAITGLAIDGSAKYSDRRHAQNAADTAAIAGALKMTDDKTTGVKCPPISGSPTPACADVIDAAKNRAADNGYDDNKVTNVVEVNIPPANGIYSDCADVHFDCTNYVQVIITSHKPTWFMRILGIKESTNVVQGVAAIIGEESDFSFGGNAVVALSPSDCKALSAQGSSRVTIYGGGMYSNSDNSTCAFFRQSCPSGILDVYTDPSRTTEGSITMVGSTTSGCITTNAQFQSGATQIGFPPPYQEIAEPAECSQTADLPANYIVTGTGSNKTATLSPGHYSKLPVSGQWKYMVLTPGVYCIDTTLSSQDSLTVSGDPVTGGGVLLYIRSGGSFTLNGGAVINLWGINDNNDSSLDPYKGFLMYVAPNYSTGTPATCKINGNNDYTLKGTIYAPYCNININGTSNTGNFQSQVIGYTVEFAGTADVVLSYDDGNNHIWNIPSQVGLTK
jgi:hypothetical protein